MSATPITDEAWAGLPLLICNMDPGRYFIDVAAPMLVIRDEPGSRVEILDDGHGRGGMTFRQAPLRFDLFEAGVQMNAFSDRTATKSLVVAVPANWLALDDDAVDGGVRLRSRYQFSDAWLKRLVWRLTTHHSSDLTVGEVFSRAVSRAIVDRLIRLELCAEARRPQFGGLPHDVRHSLQSWIDSSLQEPPTLAALAAAAGMGQIRFVRQFKVTFESTPRQYIEQRRMVRARALLKSTDAPLSTIALECGFSSQSHFSTVFRAALGLTPGQFRRLGHGGDEPARSTQFRSSRSPRRP